MILHEETYKKFGYWPKDLTKYSHSRVVHECSSCKTIKDYQMKSISKRKHKTLDLCYPCTRLVPKKTARNDDIILSPGFLANLLLLGNINDYGRKKPVIFVSGQGSLGIADSYRILSSIGMMGGDAHLLLKNRKYFKSYLIDYSVKRGKSFAFDFVNHFLAKRKLHNSGRSPIIKQLWAPERFTKIFDLLGFRYRFRLKSKGETNKESGIFFLYSASFYDYKTESWIHIGS